MTTDTGTHPTTTSVPTVVPPPAGAPRQLLRRRPRVFGGVAAGLAAYLGLPTALVRLLFVVSAFMGWGLLLYPALWIVIPEN